jgi:hypothetical protein
MKMTEATMIFAGNEFNLSVDLLSDCLITKNVKLDEKTGYVVSEMRQKETVPFDEKEVYHEEEKILPPAFDDDLPF